MQFFIWDEENANGNVAKLAINDLTTDEVESAFDRIVSTEESDRSGMDAILGRTHTGEFIFVTYQKIDDMTILVGTAYKVPFSQKKFASRNKKRKKGRKRK